MDEVPLPTPSSQSEQPATSTPAMPASVSPSITPEQVAALLGKPMICPRCHFAVKPEYYFCPNCGAKLTEAPLGVGLLDQLLLYAFSLILPWIAYLAITKWQGIKYLRAPDMRTKQIGLIALVLLVVSSIIAFWLTYQWIQSYVQQSLNDVNNLGGLGGTSGF
jgi:hypothetical protein